MDMDDQGASDEVLLERYAQGESRAFEVFFLRHRSRVYHYALRRLKRPELAAELVQEVFLKLHASIHQYRFGERALPWFFAIVHYACLDELRKMAKADRSFTQLAHMEIQIASHSTQAWAQDTSQSSFSLADSVQQSLNELSYDQRQVIEKRWMAEQTFRQIAHETGKNEASLRKIYSRAVTRLRAWFAPSDEGKEKL